jgi:hypothetical protein
MALRITNAAVVKKVEQLAKATGLSTAAVVELALDRLISEKCANSAGRMAALLAQFDRIPDLPAAFDPLAWDEHGLPQ